MSQLLRYTLLSFLAIGCKTASFRGNTGSKNTPPPAPINTNSSNAVENPIIPNNGSTTTETEPDGTVITTTKNPDGTSSVTSKDPDGTITSEVTKPTGEVTTVVNRPDGSGTKEIKNPDGTKTTTTVITRPDGSKTTETKHPDGSKTIEDSKPQSPTVITSTKPDGTKVTTTIIKHPDGTSTTETTTTPPGGTPITETKTTKPDGTGIPVVTSPGGKTSPTTPVTPSGPGKGGKPKDPVFIDCPDNPDYMLKAELYEIPANSSRVPNFSTLQKKKDICLRQLDVVDRKFTEGFPGIPGLVEWFALDIKWRVNIPEEGVYTFYLNSDDGSFLYIDNLLVINNDGLHPQQEKTQQAKLSKGWHNFQVSWYQGPRYNIALELFWKRPNTQQREYIPVQYFARP